MNLVCKPYLEKFIIVFIDDILIYSRTKEDHEVHLKIGLELLKKEKLFAKFSKCEFWLQEVYFLGHVVNSNDIHVESSKIEVMKNWKVPKTLSEIGRTKSVIYTDYKSLQHIFDQKELNMRQRRWIELFSDFDSEASKVENATAEMLRGLYQLMERKEDGADKTYYDLKDMYGSHVRRRILLPMFPRSSSGYDTNWVIVDRLTKSAHFLSIREDYKIQKLARLYIDEIVAGHEVPVSIILDRDGRFNSRFWQTLWKALGTRLDMSMAYHPQTDGQTEFSYNNNYHSSIRCAPFEALYGRKCRSLVLWAKIGERRLIGPKLVQEATDRVVLIKEKLKAARDRQKSYADNRRKPLEFEIGDQVLLKVSP
ncbi:putative reverse transcriptase domain-containing protein [Tanacetum coccineum]